MISESEARKFYGGSKVVPFSNERNTAMNPCTMFGNRDPYRSLLEAELATLDPSLVVKYAEMDVSDGRDIVTYRYDGTNWVRKMVQRNAAL